MTRQESLQSVYSLHHSLTLFSSVAGGFSSYDAHRLQDLIRIVRLLRLRAFNSSELYDAAKVGEGGSYRVFRCEAGATNFVAVKQVKLPCEQQDNHEFRRRVCCVKKDLEIMHHQPLANHPNIVSLLGYGWRLFKDSALPFLVTEFAHHGNLRQYLQAHATNVGDISRMKLVGQIASGLHALHACGVAHGDVKLENVLVFQSLSAKDLDSDAPVPKLVSLHLSCFGVWVLAIVNDSLDELTCSLTIELQLLSQCAQLTYENS